MNLISKLIQKILLKYADEYTLAYTSPPKTPLTLAYSTLKYQLASLGIPITKNESFLNSLKNKHQNKRCFILGNGPSLNNCDLTLLKNEITFGFNSIFLNYEKMGFYPTYYIVEDVLVAEDRYNEINNLVGPVKFFGNHLDYVLKNNNQVYWLNVIMNYKDYPDFPHFSTNAIRKLWAGGTVTYLALQLAFLMGFKEVYMIGYDHSYTIPKTVLLEHSKITSTEDDVNHFHPDYFGKGYRWHDPRTDRMEAAYKKAKIYFEAANKKIYNATVGGKLEVFERVDYISLFKV